MHRTGRGLQRLSGYVRRAPQALRRTRVTRGHRPHVTSTGQATERVGYQSLNRQPTLIPSGRLADRSYTPRHGGSPQGSSAYSSSSYSGSSSGAIQGLGRHLTAEQLRKLGTVLEGQQGRCPSGTDLQILTYLDHADLITLFELPIPILDGVIANLATGSRNVDVQKSRISTLLFNKDNLIKLQQALKSSSLSHIPTKVWIEKLLQIPTDQLSSLLFMPKQHLEVLLGLLEITGNAGNFFTQSILKGLHSSRFKALGKLPIKQVRNWKKTLIRSTVSSYGTDQDHFSLRKKKEFFNKALKDRSRHGDYVIRELGKLIGTGSIEKGSIQYNNAKRFLIDQYYSGNLAEFMTLSNKHAQMVLNLPEEVSQAFWDLTPPARLEVISNITPQRSLVDILNPPPEPDPEPVRETAIQKRTSKVPARRPYSMELRRKVPRRGGFRGLAINANLRRVQRHLSVEEQDTIAQATQGQVLKLIKLPIANLQAFCKLPLEQRQLVVEELDTFRDLNLFLGLRPVVINQVLQSGVNLKVFCHYYGKAYSRPSEGTTRAAEQAQQRPTEEVDPVIQKMVQFILRSWTNVADRLTDVAKPVITAEGRRALADRVWTKLDDVSFLKKEIPFLFKDNQEAFKMSFIDSLKLLIADDERLLAMEGTTPEEKVFYNQRIEYVQQALKDIKTKGIENYISDVVNLVKGTFSPLFMAARHRMRGDTPFSKTSLIKDMAALPVKLVMATAGNLTLQGIDKMGGEEVLKRFLSVIQGIRQIVIQQYDYASRKAESALAREHLKRQAQEAHTVFDNIMTQGIAAAHFFVEQSEIPQKGRAALSGKLDPQRKAQGYAIYFIVLTAGLIGKYLEDEEESESVTETPPAQPAPAGTAAKGEEGTEAVEAESKPVETEALPAGDQELIKQQKGFLYLLFDAFREMIGDRDRTLEEVLKTPPYPTERRSEDLRPFDEAIRSAERTIQQTDELTPLQPEDEPAPPLVGGGTPAGAVAAAAAGPVADQQLPPFIPLEEGEILPPGFPQVEINLNLDAIQESLGQAIDRIGNEQVFQLIHKLGEVMILAFTVDGKDMPEDLMDVIHEDLEQIVAGFVSQEATPQQINDYLIHLFSRFMQAEGEMMAELHPLQSTQLAFASTIQYLDGYGL